ncbi:MFS transporter [Salininema proteolyticum]|uniref:MFS transporter n=1 Tax=Salininema proteolyticum TaxID=1607685 RepID=A0ABV8U1A7_9ACTN
MPLVLISLAAGTFAIGTTEFVVAGILPEIAAEYGTSLPAAGSLVSVYALGMVVGAPLLTALTVRMPRKGLILGLLALFVAGNLVSAFAPSLAVLVVGRVMSAFAGGAFAGTGIAVATRFVPPEKKARAVAFVFMGLSVANVVGVPLGTVVGQNLGWRYAFLIVTAIGVLSMAGVALTMERLPRPQGTGLGGELAVFRKGEVWAAIAATALGWAPMLAVLTYIAPVVTEVAGGPETLVAGIMLLFGAGMLAGTPLGGRLAERNLFQGLLWALVAVAALSASFTFMARSPLTLAVAVAAFGVATSATLPLLQTWVIGEAAGAEGLASAANISAFNIGNALGPFLGGAAVSAGLGRLSPSWIATGLAASAVVVVGLVAASRNRSGDPAGTADPEPRRNLPAQSREPERSGR